MTEKIVKGGEFLVKELNKKDIFIPEEFSVEQKQIADTARQLVENEISPNIEAIEGHDFELVKKLFSMCGELGLLATDVPEEFGGLELDKVTSMIVAENIAPSGSFSVAFTAHTGIGTLPLVYYGTKAQKDQYLEKLVDGKWVAAYCLTEPNSGSDALSAKATAVLSEDKKYYILNGTKQFITNGGFAKLFTVFAKIDKEHFTAFLVDSDFEGVSLGPEEKKMGIKGSSTCSVILEDAKVPIENLLGEKGRGHKIAFNILNIGRLKLGASVTGAGKAAIGESIKYAKDRKQFGTSICNFGAIKEKFANMVGDIFASESLVYRLAGDLDVNFDTLDKSSTDYYADYEKVFEDFSVECAISKVFCSEALSRVVDEGVQIYGGYGFIQEYPAEKHYRDERINRLFEGTNEINRLVITGGILKKSLKGELPLQAEAMKAFEGLMSPSLDEVDPSVPFEKEKYLIHNLKQILLILAGAAAQKFMDKLQHEQEILISAADVIILIYAIESAVSRAEKAYEAAGDKKKQLLLAVVEVFTFNALESLSKAAKQAAFYIEEGDNLLMILSGIRRYTKYAPVSLLNSKRLLADSIIESEAYLF
ncbi:MAG: acyl-CoA dehydrogenase family protein [Deltaproteobacteria bacterium]|nr:acyl-CoA dehydrogenase family protein [Deltaproteobacteria bacterium]